MGIGRLFDKVVGFFKGTTADTKKAYNDLDQGKKISYTPRSDRYTYNESNDTDYNKNWKPSTKEEKETLSPGGFHRVKERAKAKAELQGQMSDQDFNDAYKEKQMSVDSTCLSNLEYDPEDRILAVKFQGNSKQYKYPQVPMELVQGLMKSPSKGEFFMEKIHDQYTLNPGHRPQGKAEGQKYKKYFDRVSKEIKESRAEQRAMDAMDNGD